MSEKMFGVMPHGDKVKFTAQGTAEQIKNAETEMTENQKTDSSEREKNRFGSSIEFDDTEKGKFLKEGRSALLDYMEKIRVGTFHDDNEAFGYAYSVLHDYLFDSKGPDHDELDAYLNGKIGIAIGNLPDIIRKNIFQPRENKSAESYFDNNQDNTAMYEYLDFVLKQIQDTHEAAMKNSEIK